MSELNIPKSYISVSQLNLYDYCPMKYKFKYIDRQRPSNVIYPNSLLIGIAFHKYIKNLYDNNFDNVFIDNLQPEILIMNTLINYLLNDKSISIDTEDIKILHGLKISPDRSKLKSISNRLMSIKSHIDFFDGKLEILKTKNIQRPSTIDIFVSLCEYFLENYITFNKNLEVLTIEDKLEYTFNRYNKDFNLLAYLDFLGNDDNNNIYIIDWKTSKKKWDENDILKRQDSIYSYMIWKTQGIIPIFRYIVFSYSEKTSKITHQIFEIKHDIVSLEKTEKNIHDVIRGITNNIFPKNETSFLCSKFFCEYYTNCQNYKNNVFKSNY